MNFRRSVAMSFTGAIILLMSAAPVRAKRSAPKPVEPVVIGSVRYSAPVESESMGFIVAADVASGKELWRQRIYRVLINPFLEEDVQWVFINSLVRRGRDLLITNERGKHFTLDLETRRVTEHD